VVLGFAIIAGLFLLLSAVLLWPFANFLMARHGGFAYPLFVIGLFLAILGLYVVGSVVFLLARMLGMSRPAHALKVASDLAGEAPRETSFNSVSVYAFGAADLTAMLQHQADDSRSDFESLVGESIASLRPLRFFIFGRRQVMEAVLRRALAFPGNSDGTYIPWPTRTIAVTTEVPGHRLINTERIVRMLLGYFFLDCYVKHPAPLWVQVGLANAVSGGRDEEELARLNRRMLAALSNGSVLGSSELFHAPSRALAKLVRDWQIHENFTRFVLFGSQSWSIVGFLCGTEDRRKRFRAFLQSLGPKISAEEMFKQNFGYDFETLLADWRRSVLSRGSGTHAMPSPEARATLLECVIPTIQDRGAKPIDRILAVREMGKAGYSFGADVLIGLLDEDQEIPKKEIIWALETISGRVLNDSPSAWDAWLDQLPAEAV
jgi:hypothetical protein